MRFITRGSLLALCLLSTAAAGAQTVAPELPGSRITNAGITRANGAVDSVYLKRRVTSDTIDIGDWTSYMFARLFEKLGIPTFSDSLKFRVTSDSARIRITGRLSDFPPEARDELVSLFTFLDPSVTFVTEISMVQAKYGIMSFRLERARVGVIPIPDVFISSAMMQYNDRYPVLSNGARELHISIPDDATAKLVTNGIVISVPRKP